jgi:hypothetical protein
MTFHISLNYYLQLFYNFTMIPRIRYLTFPPLIQRDVCQSKHLFEFFKLFSYKCFGEDVCNLLTCGTMYQLNGIGLYMKSNKTIDDFRGEISPMGEIKGPLIFYWTNFLY